MDGLASTRVFSDVPLGVDSQAAAKEREDARTKRIALENTTPQPSKKSTVNELLKLVGL